MLNNSKILLDAYETFMLPLGGKKVPTPYRRNEKGEYQRSRPEFQGKSSPEVLINTTKKLAQKQKFNLEKATVKEIRKFMIKNKLGIDCSGFIYRMLNELVQKSLGKPLTALGFEHVGRTNVAKLTSNENSIQIKDFKDIKPGDLIRIDSDSDDGLLHALVVLDNQDGVVTYAQSSRKTKIDGVHKDVIVNGNFPKDLSVFLYNPKGDDGIRRLKILV